MPKKKPKAPEPEDPRPRFFYVDAYHSFEEVLADIRRRTAAGELYYTNIHVRPKPGSEYAFEVEYKKPYLGQQELM